ncbi:MAG: hypothetical protein ACFN0Z_04650, partial [Parascardovia denticolens]
PIIRMDADTTAKKGEHQRLLELFDATPGAVLIGTQMIAKGLDFPIQPPPSNLYLSKRKT